MLFLHAHEVIQTFSKGRKNNLGGNIYMPIASISSFHNEDIVIFATWRYRIAC